MSARFLLPAPSSFRPAVAPWRGAKKRMKGWSCTRNNRPYASRITNRWLASVLPSWTACARAGGGGIEGGGYSGVSVIASETSVASKLSNLPTSIRFGTQLNYAVQTTIDGILSLRILRGPQIDHRPRLSRSLRDRYLRQHCCISSQKADQKDTIPVSSTSAKITGRPVEPDTFTPTLQIDDNTVLRQVIQSTLTIPVPIMSTRSLGRILGRSTSSFLAGSSA